MDIDLVNASICNTLAEDVGSGDISAELIDSQVTAMAKVICKEQAVLCGVDWFTSVFRQLDPQIDVRWLAKEGEQVDINQCVVELTGCARSLLTGERSALNWLQTLSGTATVVRSYLDCLQDTTVVLLDTRKTLPGLRYAQKHAVKVAGGCNHRMGLYDAYLIKENHIASCGSIKRAISQAKELHSDKVVEVEVESLEQLAEAIDAAADIIMLDNFNLEQIKQAVTVNQHRVKLEVSGDVSLANIAAIAATGIDFISVGALTKHVRAIDFSMRLSVG